MDGGVPMGQLLPLSGWDVDEGNKKCFSCFWAGNDSDIPDALKQAVMPGLDSLLEKAVKVKTFVPNNFN